MFEWKNRKKAPLSCKKNQKLFLSLQTPLNELSIPKNVSFQLILKLELWSFKVYLYQRQIKMSISLASYVVTDSTFRNPQNFFQRSILCQYWCFSWKKHGKRHFRCQHTEEMLEKTDLEKYSVEMTVVKFWFVWLEK